MGKTISDGEDYQAMRRTAWGFSRQFTYERTLQEFEAAIAKMCGAV